MPKPKRAVISVRKPPADPDLFVATGVGAKTPKHQSAKTPKHQTSSKRRLSIYLPADVAKALGLYALTHERDKSDVATESVCKLIGIPWPRP